MRPCHINRRSRSKYARNRFERALDNVVRVFTRKLFHVQRNFRLTHERKPKFFAKLAIEIAHFFKSELQINRSVISSRQIYRSHDKRFVHRQKDIPVTGNAAFFTERLGKRLTKRNAYIFRRVVIIDLRIPFATHRQIVIRVLGKEGKHMVEKAATAINFAFAFAVQIKA